MKIERVELPLDGTAKIPPGKYRFETDLLIDSSANMTPALRERLKELCVLDVALVAVPALHLGRCDGCAGAARFAPDVASSSLCGAARAGAQTLFRQPYCNNSQIFIRDNEAGWDEYLKARMNCE